MQKRVRRRRWGANEGSGEGKTMGKGQGWEERLSGVGCGSRISRRGNGERVENDWRTYQRNTFSYQLGIHIRARSKIGEWKKGQ